MWTGNVDGHGVAGPYSFKIGDTTAFSEYVQGGVVTQVKMPKTIHFVGLLTCCTLYVVIALAVC